MDRVIERALREECPTHAGDASSSPSVIQQTLGRVFANNLADMTAFFVDLFVNDQKPVELVIHYHQKQFRSVLLRHARSLGLEAEPQADESNDAPADKTTALSQNLTPCARQRKRRYPSSAPGRLKKPPPPPAPTPVVVLEQELWDGFGFHIKFLLSSGPLVIARQYHTRTSIRLICATLMDETWHKTCNNLSDIPYLIVYLLLGFHPKNSAPRAFITNSLLNEQALADPFVEYQLQYPTELFTQRLELVYSEKAALVLSSHKQLRDRVKTATNSEQPSGQDQTTHEEMLRESGPLEIGLLTLTAYMYFRYRMSELNAPPEQLKALFTLLMCIFEELGRSVNSRVLAATNHDVNSVQIESAIHTMPTSTRDRAARDIRASPTVYRRLLDIATDLNLFIRFRALGEYRSAVGEHDGGRVPLIQRLYCSMGRLELRLNELRVLETARQSHNIMGERKVFHWAKAYQTPRKDLIKDFSRRLVTTQAQSLKAFVAKYPDCVTFVVEERLQPHQIINTIRYLNRKYPSLRMHVMGFRSTSGDPSQPVTMETENTEDLLRPEGSAEEDTPLIKSLLKRNDAMAVIHDGNLCIICYSSPKAHQRLCDYELMETLTTSAQEKLLPFYTHLVRLYCSVFERVDRNEQDAERILEEDKESLWIAVQILIYQLCRYTPQRYKRMIVSALRCILHPSHLLFDVYRWLHFICEKLSAYMVKYPFFRTYGDDEQQATYTQAHQALTNTCDILLCFLCLNTMHVVPGAILERIRLYLRDLERAKNPHFDTHKDLYLYIGHLKKTLKTVPQAPQVDLTEKRYVALQFYPQELQSDRLHEQSQLFRELLFDAAYQHRDKDRRVWLNVLVYRFCVDRNMDLTICGDTLFCMNYEIEQVDRRIYWRQARVEGKDHEVVSTGTRTPKPPGTPNTAYSSAPSTPGRGNGFGSRPTTPRPATPTADVPRDINSVQLQKDIFRQERAEEWDKWQDVAQLPDTEKRIDGLEDLVSNHEEQNKSSGQDQNSTTFADRRVSAKHLILRQIDRESKAGYGWVDRDRSNWRTPPRPFAETAKRFMYYGLNRIFTEPQLFMASVEYSHFFCWPRVKPPKDELRPVSPDRIKHIQPPGPVYYLRGDESTDAKFNAACERPGAWRRHLIGLDQEDRIEPLVVMMRELEWMLYARNHTESSRLQYCKIINASACVWTLQPEEFIRKQLNCRLPVDYRVLTHVGVNGADQVVGEFLCLEDSIWILGSDEIPDQETVVDKKPVVSAPAAAASSSVQTSAETRAPSSAEFVPSDAELRYMCTEHSKVFYNALVDLDAKAMTTEELPLARFIRSLVSSEPRPDARVQSELEELIEEGLDEDRPPVSKKRAPESAEITVYIPGASHMLYSNKPPELQQSLQPQPQQQTGTGIPSNNITFEGLGFDLNQYGTHSWVSEMSEFYTTTQEQEGDQ